MLRKSVAQRAQKEEHWTTILQPHGGWFDVNIKELWRYKDLIILLVKRDFISVYKQTILGPLWFFLQPMFSTLVFAIIFGEIAKISTQDLPPILFYMSGIIVWNYFSSCLTGTSNTFVNNAGIFGKVYFPRLVMPISTVISSLLTFIIQLCLLIVFLTYFYINGSNIQPNLGVIFLPLLLIHMAALGLGTGILISSLTTKYRDLTFAVGFGVQLWMYATPIVYPLSEVPTEWQWLVALNPMTAIVETFRYVFLGSGGIALKFIGISLCITLAILAIGILFFTRVEKTFMDSV